MDRQALAEAEKKLPPEQFPSPILEAVVGSTLHGTAVDDGLEDFDIMGIVIESPYDFVGFGPKDTWVQRTKPDGVRSEKGDIDRSMYGLRKYLQLALKGNPTLLLILFAPEEFLLRHDARGRSLQAMAPSIVSKQCYFPWRGYMKQQHERLLGLRGQRNITRPELVDKYGYDTKYAAHIVRLGRQGEEMLRTGRLTLPMPPEDRSLVRAVRTGGYSLAEVSGLILEAEKRLDAAYAASPLRLHPDYDAVEAWMVQAYLSAWRPT